LHYISPIFAKYNFRWCISEGLTRYIYGISDNVQEIAIDLDVNKDDEKFKEFLKEIKDKITLPLNHWHDKVYEHYVMEVTVDGMILSICPTQNMNIFNKSSGQYELFYKEGVPTPNMVVFEGLEIPLLPKDRFVKMEEHLGK
ncbi:MAG TPA: hypothetical protein VEW42_00955, partial [Candidatus Eisenbacteria bacterium]|nr:hypothetical protein [Candidatus Eisenbacteria bacterium]